MSSPLSYLEHSVLNWLEQVPATAVGDTALVDAPPALRRRSDYLDLAEQVSPTPRKHKRSASPSPSRRGPISPPPTNSSSSQRNTKLAMSARTPSPKKRKTNQGSFGLDPDTTPRPLIRNTSATAMPPPPASISSQSASETSSQSQQSGTGTSSPRKRMLGLAVEPEGMVRKILTRNAHDIPPALAEMYKTMLGVNNGIGVISSKEKAAITAESEHDLRAADLPEWAFADPALRDALGPTPSVKDVLGVIDYAEHCLAMDAGEAAWNGEVHSILLKLAIYGGYSRPRQLVNWANCTIASIIKEYLPPTVVQKKVDFCIILDPEVSHEPTDVAMARRINDLRRALPLTSINHTDLISTISRPIVVSIETKRGGDSLEQAQLQTVTWQMAQWKLLAALTGGYGSSEDGDRAGRAGDPLDGLPFLPAVIIQGHDWSFAATSRDGTRKVFWYDCPFGSTRDVIGVYKIIYGLQKLAAFSKDVFWPWYKVAVLRAEDDQCAG